MDAVGFGLAAACALLSAIAVVRSPDLVHAVLWLGLTLLATAVLYAMLGASFIAGVQVLLYVGGVVTLMVFGVMMTRRHDGKAPPLPPPTSVRAAVVALALFVAMGWAVLATEDLDGPVPPLATTTADLGQALLHEHVLAFEVVSMLLLAAMVGAIVIARRKDPGAATHPAPRRGPRPLPTPEAAE